MTLIAPSILSADFSRLGEELKGILDEFLSEMPDDMSSGLDLSDLDKISPQ